jgi:DNA-binding IclR family transcriptional regulator
VLVTHAGRLRPLSEGMGIRRATIHAMLEQLQEDEEIAR